MHQKKRLPKSEEHDPGALGIIYCLEKVMDELRATEPLLFHTWDESGIPDLNCQTMITSNDEVAG